MNLPSRDEKITIGKPNPDRGALWALVQESKITDGSEIVAQVDYLQNGHKPTREWVVWMGDHWKFREETPCGQTLHGREAILRDALARASKWSP